MFYIVSKEQEKAAKVSRRLIAIDEVHSNVNLLDEMLISYKKQELPKSELETLQVNDSSSCLGGWLIWVSLVVSGSDWMCKWGQSCLFICKC